ncbi:MAG: single-stranded DNA-binding protein [Desulfovermiculus sp.]
MSTYQNVVVLGRLGQDPELRYTQSGVPVTSMSLATDEGYVDKQGQKVDRTEWHRVTVWNKQAENVCRFLGKGRLALVEGKLQTRKWQDQQGQDRYTTEIRAQRVIFVGNSPNSGGQGQGQGAPAPQGQGGSDPFASGPAFPTEAGGIDDAPF